MKELAKFYADVVIVINQACESNTCKSIISILSDAFYFVLTVLIIPLMKRTIKETYGRYRARKDLHQREIISKIRELFKDKIDKYGFDRVLLLEIHNGVRTVNGLSLKKFSCTVETLKDRNTTSIKADIQEEKLIDYDRYIEKFLDEPLEYCTNIFDYPDEHIKAAMDLKGIKSFFVYFITNTHGLPIGWVRFEATKERTYTDEDIAEISDGIKLLAHKIAYLYKL